MAAFLIRRSIFLLFTLLGVSIAIFAISELAPANIARNVLGNTITPDQEASFNAQNGLDQDPVTRYIRWIAGSDWQATSLIGSPVVRVYNPQSDRQGWYVQGPDNMLYRHRTSDGETMTRLEYTLQPDGTITGPAEVDLGNTVWTTDADGNEIFWGVDEDGRAAMWLRGNVSEEQRRTMAGWVSVSGAPIRYIPLQKGLIRGDPGVSLITRQPVADTLIPRLLNTLILAGSAFVIIMPIALVLGVIAGLNEGKPLDRGLSIFGLSATATPEFASGVFLILIFSVWLGWFPGAVVLPPGVSVLDRPQVLVLPIMTLMLIELGYVLRITRASMVEVMRTSYIRTATLKGLPYWRIVIQHALRNSLLAPITIIMLHINWLIGGIVVVESLFGYPGLGRYVLDSALNNDIFAIEAAAMILVVIAVFTQLLADILYVYLNPRIRYS